MTVTIQLSKYFALYFCAAFAASSYADADGRSREPELKESFYDSFHTGEQGPELLKLCYFEAKNTAKTCIAMMTTEVSFAQYSRFAKEKGLALPADRNWSKEATRPMINISWYTANAYAEWLSEQTGQHYRLPTEQEWLAAATPVKDLDCSKANYGQRSGQCANYRPKPIRSYPSNALGFYDLYGNVWEWMENCGTDGCLLKGGSWLNESYLLTPATCEYRAPHLEFDTVGFRLVREYP